APVKSVLYIEGDPRKADFALLKIGRRTDGSFPKRIELASTDAAADADIVVIGYPARAPSHIIPDQAWMDRLYGSTYDIKRIAPGKMGKPSRGWSTHDATTLGGNSGSVVLDLKSGKAVGLHFAGLYMIENYCVPSSTLNAYIKDAPWSGSGRRTNESSDATAATTAVDQSPVPTAVVAPFSNGEVTLTIPLTIRVSLGQPGSVTTATVDPVVQTPPAKPTTPADTKTVEAAQELQREIRGNGVLAVRHGYLIDRNGLSDTPCIVVAADPSRLEDVRARAPKTYKGFPVDVREASLRDQAEAVSTEFEQEAAAKIQYDDDNRTGEAFSFDFVDEEMDAIIHVGPERSWTVLSEFLRGTKKKLVSSIYEFHATHIADALEQEMSEGADFKLVAAPQTRDPKSGNLADGDFKRGPRFEQWGNDFPDQFERVFVPVGSQGLVSKAYHIKVTVRDGKTFWLSSGNWKRASQPNIAEEDLNNPRETGKAGNREWHVVIENKTLASRYENHILADYERCLELGGTLESVEEQVMVDVPIGSLEAIELEAAPKKVFEPLVLKNRRIKVKPLLTPDQQGNVYCQAVLELIRSAKKQLLFQNQYITVGPHSTGLFGELVDALVERSQSIPDVRVILRSGGSDFWDDMAELKRRGMDVNKCVRRISATHTKGIVVDGKRVLIGSHNWSSLGVTLNRDASLIFHDPEIAQYYASVFEEDWARSSEIEAESAFAGGARLAVGDAPPPGFVRMPLSQYLEG
ncbi:MAG TPA: phospholipase D-like domain-containing protein, partial [Thermoanaerobaculia bacterium]